MRELLLTVAKFGPEYKSRSAEWRLINIIFDLLPKMRAFPICLPEPKDDRLQRITQELFMNPNDASSLSVLATSAGLSMRTADRLFLKEIGMSFGKWRQQLRLIIALQKLAYGEKITNVALDIGYNNVSSFNSMFKKNFNIPPSHFIRQINDINIPTMASTQVSKIPLSSPIKYAELFWQSPENKMYLYSASLE
jgi:AraC-like DNA-binding protein